MENRPTAGELLNALETGTHVEFAADHGVNLQGLTPDQVKEILKLACLVGQPFLDQVCTLILNS